MNSASGGLQFTAACNNYKTNMYNIPLEQQEQEGKPPTDASASTKNNKMALEKTETNALTGEPMSPIREFLFVACICCAQFTTQVALSQCIAILHIIGNTFGLTNPGELSWLIAAYSLTVGTFILVAGRFGDIFGYKKMLIIGFLWFAVWSMVAGLAVYSNHVLFNFARALQGIGPAICLPNGLAILGATYAPGPRKDMIFAVFGAVAPVGSVIGATFGGVFALAWWPWCFWSCAIALVGLAILGHFVIPDPPGRMAGDAKGRSFRQLFKELDLLGGIIGITALATFNFAWNQAPIVGWDKAYVIVCLVLGLALACVFFFIEIQVAKYPLIPFEVLTVDVAFVLTCVACGWSSFGIWFYYTWQFYEESRHMSPLLGAAYITPAAISGACAAVLTGFLLSRIRPAWVMTIALTAFTIGNVLIGTTPVDQIYWGQQFFSVVVTPFGMDMSFPAATLLLSNAVRKEHQGVAASLVNTVVNYSISLGLGFAGTVEVHVNHGGRTPKDLLHGYRGAWYMGMGLSGLGLFVSVVYLMRSYVLERKQRFE